MNIKVIFIGVILICCSFLYGMESNKLASRSKKKQEIITADGGLFKLAISQFGVLKQCNETCDATKENFQDSLALPMVQSSDLIQLLDLQDKDKWKDEKVSLAQALQALKAADALNYKNKKVKKGLIGAIARALLSCNSCDQAITNIELLKPLDGTSLSELINTASLNKHLTPSLLPFILCKNQHTSLKITSLLLSSLAGEGTSELLHNKAEHTESFSFKRQRGSAKQGIYTITNNAIPDTFVCSTQSRKLVQWHPSKIKYVAKKQGNAGTGVSIYRLKKKRQIRTHTLVHAGSVKNIFWHATCKNLIAIATSDSLTSWMLYKKGLLEKLGEFYCTDASILDAHWHSNLKTLAVAAGTMTYVFDCMPDKVYVGSLEKNNSRNIKYFLPHLYRVAQLAWDPRNLNRIATESFATTYLWHLGEDGKAERLYKVCHDVWVNDLSWSPFYKNCLLGGLTNTKAQILFFNSSKKYTQLKANHPQPKNISITQQQDIPDWEHVNSGVRTYSAWHPTNKNCFASFCHKNVRIWYILNQKKISCIAQVNLDYKPFSIAWSSNGTMIGLKNESIATVINLAEDPLLQKIKNMALHKKIKQFYREQGVLP